MSTGETAVYRGHCEGCDSNITLECQKFVDEEILADAFESLCPRCDNGNDVLFQNERIAPVAPPAGAQGETGEVFCTREDYREAWLSATRRETAALQQGKAQAEEVSRLRAENTLLHGAMRAQDDREIAAAERLSMVHTCDWPDDVAEEVQALQAQLECMVAPEERDQWKREAQRLADLLSEAQQRIETLTDALLTVKANCQGHCDEFSGRVWMVAELALNGGPDKP